MMHKKIKQIIRPLIQGLSALAFNLNLSGFASGSIYTGPFKGVCVPVLNCYSCPGAVGACPIGALQSSFAAIGGKLAYYVLGMLLLFSITLGRFFCGWLCPFGAAQGLLHKAPVKKLKIPKRVDAPLRYLKYAALFVLVIGLPLLARNGVNMSSPYFCKWICPLGAFYALMNRVSLLGIRVDGQQCISCGKCAGVCKMDVEITKTPDHGECIRCGKCINVCPVDAVSFHYGFGRLEKQ